MPRCPVPPKAAYLPMGVTAAAAPLALGLSLIVLPDWGLAAPQALASASAPGTASRTTARVQPMPVRKPDAVSAEPELGEELLAVARRVHQGIIACELGASVSVHADLQRPGYFDLTLHRQRFRMAPVATTTGAIRLEDTRAGAVWLQLANKSMLMSQKLGQRLADACMSAEQHETARRLQGQAPLIDGLTVPPPAVRPASDAIH